jgi:hypothetical protein
MTTQLSTSATPSSLRVIANKPTREITQITELSLTATPSQIKSFLEKDGTSNYLSGYYYLLKYISKKG